VRWIEVAPQGSTPSLTPVIWFESMPPARSRVSWWPRAVFRDGNGLVLWKRQ
jgi:hypothetical protein